MRTTVPQPHESNTVESTSQPYLRLDILRIVALQSQRIVQIHRILCASKEDVQTALNVLSNDGDVEIIRQRGGNSAAATPSGKALLGIINRMNGHQLAILIECVREVQEALQTSKSDASFDLHIAYQEIAERHVADGISAPLIEQAYAWVISHNRDIASLEKTFGELHDHTPSVTTANGEIAFLTHDLSSQEQEGETVQEEDIYHYAELTPSTAQPYCIEPLLPPDAQEERDIYSKQAANLSKKDTHLSAALTLLHGRLSTDDMHEYCELLYRLRSGCLTATETNRWTELFRMLYTHIPDALCDEFAALCIEHAPKGTMNSNPRIQALIREYLNADAVR